MYHYEDVPSEIINAQRTALHFQPKAPLSYTLPCWLTTLCSESDSGSISTGTHFHDFWNYNFGSENEKWNIKY